MRIGGELLVAFAVSGVMTLLLPVVLTVVLCVKRRLSFLPFLVGFGAFFVSQVCIRIPIVQIISAASPVQSFAAANTAVYILILSLTAGLFEEPARLLGCGILKRRRTYRDAVSFGIGHAFCEVIMLVGMTQINNLVLCGMINGGTIGLLGEETARLVMEQYAAIAPVDIYLGIVERVGAVSFHVAMSVLIFNCVNAGRRWSGLAIAVAAHTLFNFAVSLISQYNIYAAEGAVLLFGGAALVYTLYMRRRYAGADKTGAAPEESMGQEE